MRPETIYLDTSVVSAYFDYRARERQEATVRFWNHILPNYEVFISEITMEELDNTRDDTLRAKFKDLVKDFEVLKVKETIESLAKAYIENDIFSPKYMDDARHVAIASFFDITFLISWNFEHIVKVKTRKKVNSVNVLKGFGEIEIISPQEL